MSDGRTSFLFQRLREVLDHLQRWRGSRVGEVLEEVQNPLWISQVEIKWCLGLEEVPGGLEKLSTSLRGSDLKVQVQATFTTGPERGLRPDLCCYGDPGPMSRDVGQRLACGWCVWCREAVTLLVVAAERLHPFPRRDALEKALAFSGPPPRGAAPRAVWRG